MTRRAFTLIEMLVVIGLVGLLVAILLPVLAGTRERAKQTQALANVRTVAQTFAAYTNTYGSHPFRARGTPIDELAAPPPPDILVVRWWPEGSILGVSDHFAQSWLWPGVVSVMSDWPENYKTWISPGRPAQLPEGPWDDDIEPMDRISVVYSNTFVARPELFKPGSPPVPGPASEQSLLKATRPDEVTYPAQKVMLWDRHLAYLVREPSRLGEHYRAPTPMAFADLHAETRDPTAAADGVPNVLRFGYSERLHCTPDGIRGRDY